MTSPEKLATPDSVMALAEKLATKNHLVERDQSSYAMRERQDARDALRAEVSRLATGRDRVREAAQRLVEHADFKLGGALSADSKQRDIPSNAVSQVKARHLASLRDALAAIPAAPGATSQGVAVAQPDAPPAIKNKGVAFRDWETHPLYKSATAMGHFDAGWMRCLAATTSKD